MPWLRTASGTMSATMNNEIGIALAPEFRGKGFGPQVLRHFMFTHKPMPPKQGTTR